MRLQALIIVPCVPQCICNVITLLKQTADNAESGIPAHGNFIPKAVHIFQLQFVLSDF
jgi:hypothetical protein